MIFIFRFVILTVIELVAVLLGWLAALAVAVMLSAGLGVTCNTCSDFT